MNNILLIGIAIVLVLQIIFQRLYQCVASLSAGFDLELKPWDILRKLHLLTEVAQEYVAPKLNLPF